MGTPAVEVVTPADRLHQMPVTLTDRVVQQAKAKDARVEDSGRHRAGAVFDRAANWCEVVGGALPSW